MELVSTYYPYVLYAIPYVIAAYVLIREQLRQRRLRREIAAAERGDPILSDSDRETLMRSPVLAGGQ